MLLKFSSTKKIKGDKLYYPSPSLKIVTNPAQIFLLLPEPGIWSFLLQTMELLSPSHLATLSGEAEDKNTISEHGISLEKLIS